MSRLPLFILLFGLAVFLAWEPLSAAEPKPGEAVLLWENGAPGALGQEPKDQPQMSVYLPPPEQATGTAIVILPGGGYAGLASSYEGHDIAKWCNSFGVAGMVVEYRHRGKGYGHPAPLQDAQRAIQLVRSKADAWRLHPDRIGLLGFSAGGHLASSAGVHTIPGDPDSADPVARERSRPDFLVLCYPVIALGEPYTHRGSQINLLGEDASPELIAQMSSEKQVTDQTPPTFLWHTSEDTAVPPENSVQFYLALRRAGVEAEMHIFERGRHGLGLAQDTPGAALWPELCKAWLGSRGLLERPASN